MRAVSVQDIEPGMVVAHEVRDPLGRLLIGKGTVLQERHRKVFLQWGIATVHVEDGSESSPENAIPPEVLKEIEATVRERFRHFSQDHPAAHEIFQGALRKAVREAQQAIPFPTESVHHG